MDLGVCLLQQTATGYQIIPRLTLTLPVFRLVQKENGSIQGSLADVGRKGTTLHHRRMMERVFCWLEPWREAGAGRCTGKNPHSHEGSGLRRLVGF